MKRRELKSPRGKTVDIAALALVDNVDNVEDNVEDGGDYYMPGRRCEGCRRDLGREDPYDLIEGISGLVCAECYSKPAYQHRRAVKFQRAVVLAKFERMSTLRADIWWKFLRMDARKESIQ